MPTTYPTEPHMLAGGVVDWPALAPGADGRIRVPVICSTCGLTRSLLASTALADINRGRLAGYCKHCRRLLKPDELHARYHSRGQELRDNGVMIDWTTTAHALGQHKPYTAMVRCRCGYTRRVQVSALKVDDVTGLCQSCAMAEITAGPKNGRWKGGRHMAAGYRMIRIPPSHPMIGMAIVKSRSGWGIVREHRLVKAMELGRPLESWEQVHHKDKNRLNNDPANLVTVTPDEHGVITMMERKIAKLRAEVAELEVVVREQ